jgi:ATP:corrinoid adenosyltransferase
MVWNKKFDAIVVDDASAMVDLHILYYESVLQCFKDKPLYVFLH